MLCVPPTAEENAQPSCGGVELCKFVRSLNHDGRQAAFMCTYIPLFVSSDQSVNKLRRAHFAMFRFFHFSRNNNTEMDFPPRCSQKWNLLPYVNSNLSEFTSVPTLQFDVPAALSPENERCRALGPCLGSRRVVRYCEFEGALGERVVSADERTYIPLCD